MKLVIPAAALAAVSVLRAAPAGAATIQWNGGAADLDWNNTANWGGGVLPGSIDVAQIREDGYNAGATLNLPADVTIGRLALNYSSSNSAGKDLTLTGGTITLVGTGSPAVGFNRQNTVSGVQTINNNVVLAASQQWNAAGNNAATDGGGRIVFNGVIGETADGGGKNLTKGGNNNLELNGDNTFTGQTTIVQNTLVLGHANALGLGTSAVIVGNTVANNQQSNLITRGGVSFGRDVVVRSGQTGGSRLGGDGSGTTTWTGEIALNKDVIVTGGLGVGTGTAIFQGNLVNGTESFVGSGLTKLHGGTVKLAGSNNSYSGTTSVNTGTQLVNGVLSANDAAVGVTGTARLGGTGTINRPVNVGTGAVLSPGDGGAGVLTIGSGKALALGDNAVLEWQAGATPAASDRVDADNVAFGGAGAVLKILGGQAPDGGASYVLLAWTGDDPAGLATWSVDPESPYTGVVSYVNATDLQPGGQVVLTNVAEAVTPEPGALLAAPLVGLALGRRRRRRGSWETVSRRGRGPSGAPLNAEARGS